jgi:carboxypeptidase C (cathepsin A)
VPAWAEAINNFNDAAEAATKLDLRGIIIGNGITNETVQSNELYYTFLKRHDLIAADAHPRTRFGADNLMEKHIGYSPNFYDYRIKDIQCEACYSYNYTTWSAWFLQAEVLQALHVCGDAGNNAFAGAAGGCIDFPTEFDRNDKFDYSGALARSLDKGIAVTFYYGKADRACNYVGGYAMALALNWQGKDAFNSMRLEPLLIGGAEAGQVQHHGGLTFVQIEAAGHMVPMDQPAAVSWAVTDLLVSIR